MRVLGVILGYCSLWMQSGVQILNFRAPGNATMGFIGQRPGLFSLLGTKD